MGYYSGCLSVVSYSFACVIKRYYSGWSLEFVSVKWVKVLGWCLLPHEVLGYTCCQFIFRSHSPSTAIYGFENIYAQAYKLLKSVLEGKERHCQTEVHPFQAFS